MPENTHIKKRQVQNILNAFDYAHSLDKPFNYFVVIRLKDTIPQSSCSAFRNIMVKFRCWLEYKRGKGLTNCTPTYVFTHENPSGDNPHVNLCLFIPDNLREGFEIKIEGWIEKVQGELEEDTLHSKPLRQAGYKAVAFYINKGVDPEYIDHFNVRHWYDNRGPQGTIYGLRAGFSRSLGPKAIRDARFDPVAYGRFMRRN